MQFGPLLHAVLVRRYKRFLADVTLDDGTEITVHCPNTGAMTGCAEPGSEVWLSTSDSKTRKYPQTWELVATPRGLACIHSALANKVVQQALMRGVIPELVPFPTIRAEVKYADGSRVDFLLEGPAGRIFVEVKCVTLCEPLGQGLFPDAVSTRGRKHLMALQQVLQEPNTRAMLLFCVFHNGIVRVSAAGSIDPSYRAALEEVMHGGVEVQAWRSEVATKGIAITQQLPFALDAAR